MHRLVKNPEKENEIFKDLGFIMKYTSNDDVDAAIHKFESKFADEKTFLEYFHNTWVAGDKIRKWTNCC